MDPNFAVDYARGLEMLAGETFDEVLRIIHDEMPYAWIERYRRMCAGPMNVLKVPESGFQYLFDFCTELEFGILPPDPSFWVEVLANPKAD